MLEDLSPFWFAFLCSLVASFGTFLGGFAAFFPETSNVSHSNAAASGVMLMLCFLDLVPEALRHLSTASVGFCFVCGFVLFVLLQHRVLSSMSVSFDSDGEEQIRGRERVLASAVITSVIMFIHNAPEGLAVLLANSSGEGRTLTGLGVHTTFGIAFHNFFEGAAVAVAVFASTKSAPRALAAAALSGLSEPAAVVAGYLILGSSVSHKLVSVLMAVVSGLMTAVCLLELLPLAAKGSSRYEMWLCGGMLLSCIPSLII